MKHLNFYSSPKRWSRFVVSYDLSDDRERKRLADFLLGFGRRIHLSVFECLLDRGGRAKLERGLEKFAVRSGSVRLYRVASQTKIKHWGKPTNFDADENAACWIY